MGVTGIGLLPRAEVDFQAKYMVRLRDNIFNFELNRTPKVLIRG